MLVVLVSLLLRLTTAASLDGQNGCLFDGSVYASGQQIEIGGCLGAMTCLGNNNYGNLVQWGGVCPERYVRRIDGQSGCLFDGRVYSPGEQIQIANCLGAMTCLGNNAYSHLEQWGGICPDEREARDVDSQSGCLFDGRVYAPKHDIIIPNCLGKMTCLGDNNLGPITPLYGICGTAKREVDGQSGCLFDGHVYAAGDKINLGGDLDPLMCLGHNLYSFPKSQ